MAAIQVSKARMVELLTAVGFKNAAKMKLSQLQQNAEKYGDIDGIDDVKIEDKQLNKLHNELVTAFDKKKEVQVVEEGADEKLAKATGSKGKGDKGEEKEEGTKKKGPQKAGGEKGPGVIGTIIELLQKADENKPVSKDQILKELSKRFPDRDADGMKKTINIQLPTRIRKDKGFEVLKNENGYWIDVVPAGKKGKK